MRAVCMPLRTASRRRNPARSKSRSESSIHFSGFRKEGGKYLLLVSVSPSLLVWFDNRRRHRNNDLKPRVYQHTGRLHSSTGRELYPPPERPNHEPSLSDDASLIAATLAGDSAAF